MRTDELSASSYVLDGRLALMPSGTAGEVQGIVPQVVPELSAHRQLRVFKAYLHLWCL